MILSRCAESLTILASSLHHTSNFGIVQAGAGGRPRENSCQERRRELGCSRRPAAAVSVVRSDPTLTLRPKHERSELDGGGGGSRAGNRAEQRKPLKSFSRSVGGAARKVGGFGFLVSTPLFLRSPFLPIAFAAAAVIVVDVFPLIFHSLFPRQRHPIDRWRSIRLSAFRK